MIIKWVLQYKRPLSIRPSVNDLIVHSAVNATASLHGLNLKREQKLHTTKV